MQKFFRSLSSTFVVAALAHGSVQAQLVVCPGEPVQFEIQDTYYGIKVWEYSSDGVLWTPTTVEESTPFLVTPQAAGFYRVRFDDLDCDTTYYSNVVQLSWPDRMKLRSVFDGEIVPMDVDPVIWIEDPDGLSNVVYMINGEAVASTERVQSVPNPGSDFAVYAVAKDRNGCFIYSDTLTFDVENTNIHGNGGLQLDAFVDLTEVQVNSSVDTAAVGIGNLFSLDYNLDFIYDLIIAYRSDEGSQEDLIGIRLATSPNEYLLINERTTAWSLIMMQPGVLPLFLDQKEEVCTWLESRSAFVELEGSIRSDLNSHGSITLDSPDKVALIRVLVADLLDSRQEGSRDGGDGMYPIIAQGGATSSLVYDHNDIDLVYGARIYSNGSIASDPILLHGNNAPTSIATPVLNYLLDFLDIPDFAYQLKNPSAFFYSDIIQASSIMAIEIRLENGRESITSDEAALARNANDVVRAYHLLSWMPLSRMKKTKLPANASCFAAMSETFAEGIYAPPGEFGDAVDLSEATELADAQFALLWTYLLECPNAVIPPEGQAFYAILSTAYNAAIGVGHLAQFYWDLFTKEDRLIYRYTVVNGNFHGPLVLEDNHAEPMTGYPGSVVSVDPTIRIKERPWDIRTPEPDVVYLYLSAPIDYQGFLAADGFRFSGSMSNTTSIEVNGQVYPAPDFQNIGPVPGANTITWNLSPTATAPGVADLNVFLWHNNTPLYLLPGILENYTSDYVPFQATIEGFELYIVDGDGQSGSPNALLTTPCVVQLQTSSGVPVSDYELQAAVLEGGGSLASGTAITDANGMASFYWTLGGAGNQAMRVAVMPDGSSILTEVQFNAELGLTADCSGIPGGSALPGTPCNDGDPDTGDDHWNSDCECVGSVVDCTGTPGGTVFPGQPCSDGNPNTINDVVLANCVCAGELLGSGGCGSDVWGQPCDDGNPNTPWSVINQYCNCVPVDCNNWPFGPQMPGAYCDDEDPNSFGDHLTETCWCIGTLVYDGCFHSQYVTDIDGNDYPYVQIGSQSWFAKNLRTTRFSNGDTIPRFLNALYQTDSMWNNATGPVYYKWTGYSDNEINVVMGENRGHWYNWFVAADERNVCPWGWHVPTDEDWLELEEFLGIDSVDMELIGEFYRGDSINAGGRLKPYTQFVNSLYTSEDWLLPNVGATNEFCFSAYASGFIAPSFYIGPQQTTIQAWIWSASDTTFAGETEENAAMLRKLHAGAGGIARSVTFKTTGASIRCIQD